MKKGSYIILLAIGLAVLFTGCGSPKDKPSVTEMDSTDKRETGSIMQQPSSEEKTQSLQQNNPADEETLPQPESESQKPPQEEPGQAPSAPPEESPQPPVPPVQGEPPQENPTEENPALPDTVQGEFLKEKGQESLNLQNEKRAQAGLALLSWDEELYQCILVRGPEIAQSFSHTRPDGSSCFSVVTVSYRTVGENIAYGYPSAEAVTEGWYQSEGHRKNMLNGNFTSAAVVCYRSGGVLYWVTMFRG